MKHVCTTYALIGVNVVMFALMNSEACYVALVLDNEVLLHPWTLFSYGFTHSEPLHMAVNMAVLAVVGRWLEQRMSCKMLMMAYLAATAAGGLVFVGLNALVGGSMQLCGASAAVLALTSMAAQARREVKVEAFGRRLSVRVASYILVAPVVVSLIIGSNTGGNAAHLAGVAVGIFIGRSLFQAPDTEAIKAIKAKMSRSGFASLSESERSTLFNESKKK